MAKISKEEQWRMEGISYAIRFLESGKTLEDLQKDARIRGAYNIPVTVSKRDMHDLSNRITDIVLSRAIDLCCFVLRTEWKFGAIRIKKFMDQMDEAARQINKGDLFDWDDLDYLIEKELGLEHVSLQGGDGR